MISTSLSSSEPSSLDFSIKSSDETLRSIVNDDLSLIDFEYNENPLSESPPVEFVCLFVSFLEKSTGSVRKK